MPDAMSMRLSRMVPCRPCQSGSHHSLFARGTYIPTVYPHLGTQTPFERHPRRFSGWHLLSEYRLRD